MRKSLAPFLCFLLTYAWLAAEGKRKFRVDDNFRFKSISDIRISPQGQKIAFVLTETVPVEGKEGELKRTHDIYMVTPPDGEVHRLTSHEKGSSRPRWSPDGRYLAFVSSRTKESQIWLLDMALGGEAKQLTDWEPGVGEFAWSPDSKRIAFISTDPKDPKEEKDKTKKPKKDDPYVITRTKYLYDGEGYFGDPREWSHVWVLSVDQPKAPKKLSDGNFDDQTIEWSPDGTQIAFVSNRTGDDDNNDDEDIWVVPAQGGEVKKLTMNQGADSSPRWSPDGKFIAYLSSPEPNNFYKLRHLKIMPAQGGEPRALGQDLDREITHFLWSPDGQFLYAIVPDKAREPIYKFSVKKGERAEVIGGERRFAGLTISKDGKLMTFTCEDNDNPEELFTASIDGKALVQRTHLNKPVMDELLIGSTEKVQFKNPDGQIGEGFVIKPPDFDAQKKYPLILKIHGGPQGTDGNYFYPEGQWYAANGYVVLLVNYRGSSDYGEDWQASIAGNWYFKEYDDLMAAVDVMCQKGYVDAKRLFVTGVSYGGIMTDWIVGHTDRFAAAVSERSTVDNASCFGVDDCYLQYEKDFGLPYDEANLAIYRKTSPISYIKNCRTPILLMQCIEDHRCPLPQALQFYMGLKKLKQAEVQMVLYPRESHGIREFPHLADRLKRIVTWFDNYQKK